MWILMLVSLKYARQANRLVIPVGVDVAVLNLKAVWKQNSFLLRGPQFFLLRPSIDWVSPNHIMENTPFYWKTNKQNTHTHTHNQWLCGSVCLVTLTNIVIFSLKSSLATLFKMGITPIQLPHGNPYSTYPILFFSRVHIYYYACMVIHPIFSLAYARTSKLPEDKGFILSSAESLKECLASSWHSFILLHE